MLPGRQPWCDYGVLRRFCPPAAQGDVPRLAGTDLPGAAEGWLAYYAAVTKLRYSEERELRSPARLPPETAASISIAGNEMQP